MEANFYVASIGALFSIVCSTAVRADDASAGHTRSSIGLGLVDVQQPYSGVQAKTVPVPWLVYNNDRIFVSGTVAGYSFFIEDSYKLNLEIQPRFDHVTAGDSIQLAGIETRLASVDGGIELERSAGVGKFTFTAFHDLLGRSNGSFLGLGWIYPHPFAGGFLTSVAGVEWQSASAVSYYYGVSSAESRSNRPTYSPGGGLNAYLGVFYAHPLSKSWQWIVGARYTRLSAAVSDSPLVDRNYSSIFVGALSYGF